MDQKPISPKVSPTDTELVKEREVLTRRHVLVGGAGLAATACVASVAAQEGGDAMAKSSEPVLDAMAKKVRAGRKVMGQVSSGPKTLAEICDVPAPPYFPQPSEMQMSEDDDEKAFVLDVRYHDVDIYKRDGQIVRGKVRAFNDHVPGPTIHCEAGDRLSILLRNQLPNEDFTYDYQGCETDTDPPLNAADAGLPHGFNITNLHTHGLHVSPQSLCGDEVCPPPGSGERPTLASDDVFITVKPGEEQRYCIVLPEFHAPGTHWYHAHKHGSTSIQVNNGLVGALIVEERGEDRILGNEPHEDVIFLMQEIVEVDGGNDQLVYTDVRNDPSKFLINGVYQPRQRMRAGEVQRWRFINGTSTPRGLAKLRLVKMTDEPMLDTSDLPLTDEHRLGLDQQTDMKMLQAMNPELFERVQEFERISEKNAQPMYVIAVDGISRYGKAPKRVMEWDFAPGNRVDFLVQITEPGCYAVVKNVHDYGGGNNPEEQTLAYVEVTDRRRDMRMPKVIPGKPPCYLDPIRNGGTEKSVEFEAVSSGGFPGVCPDMPVPWICTGSTVVCDGAKRDCQPPASEPQLLPRIFTIDCERFESREVEEKYTMPLGTVEEWKLVNTGGGAHPFHIHVNPFQVVEIFDPAANGGAGETQTFDPSEATWQDVVAIPRASNGRSGYVKIRHRFLTYPGNFVIHCHFLNHEDLGMMKRVEIVPTASYPGHGPCKPVSECKLR